MSSAFQSRLDTNHSMQALNFLCRLGHLWKFDIEVSTFPTDIIPRFLSGASSSVPEIVSRVSRTSMTLND